MAAPHEEPGGDFRGVLPLPEGVVELTKWPDGSMLYSGGGIFGRKDGSMVACVRESCRISTDRGRTWGEAHPLDCQVHCEGLIRLQSGALGLYGSPGGAGRYTGDVTRWCFCSSTDDGQTWTAPVDIGTYPHFRPMHHSMIQLKSGRILLVGYWEGLDAFPPDAARYTNPGWGLWRGLALVFEGHRSLEMAICVAYYSDDEGKTWVQCKGGIFGWFDERGEPNGADGIFDVCEPTAAECKDGRVLMFMRAKVGRLVQSYSLDGGETWLSVLPTELSSSQSPPMLVQIPSTGDLLCVWSQVSSEEIRRGFLRSRLSSAISRDSGLTWENFKTLELQEGLENVSRITAEFPIPRRIVGRPGLGQLPDGFAMFSYPNVDIVGETVFIRYGRHWPRKREGALIPPGVTLQDGMPMTSMDYEQVKNLARQAQMMVMGVMRIYPLEYFYE